MSGSTGQTLGFVAGAVLGYFTGGASYIALGATIGGAVGGAIDPPKGPKIEGPRLNDLSVQTATYGAVIPRVYGTVALMGNIFWLENNQLRERSKTESQGGKGGGGGAESTTYSYYATFAVGLCEGPIAGVRRIWVGSKLIYDAGSDDLSTIIASNASGELFTIHNGAEDQLPDDRMQATLGVANTPAYRGLAYVVFKDYPLAEHGNSLLGAQVKVEVVKNGVLNTAQLVGFVQDAPLANQPSSTYANVVSTGILIRGEDSYLQVTESYSSTSSSGHLLSVTAGEKTKTKSFTVSGSSENRNYVPGESDVASYAVGGSSSITLDGYLLNLPFNGYFIFTSRYVKSGNYVYVWVENTYALHKCLYIGGSPLLSVVIPNGSTITMGSSGLLMLMINGDIKTIDENDLSILSTVNYGLPSSNSIINAGIKEVNGIKWVIKSSFIYKLNNSAIEKTYTLPFAFGGGYNSWGIWNNLLGVLNGITGELKYYNLESFNTSNTILSDIIRLETLSSSIISVSDIDVTALTQPVRGYRVASVAAIRSAIEPLQGAWPFDALQSGYKIKFKPRRGAVVATVPAIDLDSREAGKAGGVSITVGREMDSILPARVILKHIDVNREYDQGEQYAERLNTSAVNISTVELPIVMTAGEAAANVEMLLYLYWLERYDVSFSLPPTYNGLEPADVITINATTASYELRLTAINYTSDGRLECTAKYNAAAIYSPTALGEEGQSTGAVLTMTGSTAYELLDIPLLLDATDLPGFPVAMTGYLTGWPGGTVYRSDDAGQTWGNLQTFVAPGAAMGSAGTALGAGRLGMFDQAAVLSVSLISGALSSVTEAALLNGSNHFAYGAHGRWEIIAAKNCALQGDGSYVLTDLLRGRFGSEHACASHVTGDSIVLLDSNKLAFVTANLNTIGASRTYRGITAGKALTTDSDRAFTYTGVNLECLAPVYLNGNRHPSTNDWSLDWIRRTRIGGEWRDYVDATLGETTQAYEVEIYSSVAYTTLKRTITGLTSPAASYTSAQQVTDFGSNQATIYVKIYQLSVNVGRGYPLTTSITR